MDEKKAVLEAALYVADEPLDTDEIADIMNLGSVGFVQTVVDELREDLAADDRGLELIETGEGYRLQVKHQHVETVKDVAPHQDLSDAALRTLSLIAYNAPVKQTKIIDIRGNRAYDHVKELERRDLISSEKDGRTKSLDVTDSFLEYFNLDSIHEFRDSFEAETAEEFMDEADSEELEDDIDETGEESEDPDDSEPEPEEATAAQEDETAEEAEPPTAEADDGEDETTETMIEPPTG